MTSARAFTLLEATIAIALGAVIALGLFAALRVAGGAATAGARLAVENALVGEGILRALDEVDFWTAYDDPDDPARQRLRQDDGVHGLPFTPMTRVWPQVRDPDRERWRGWDDDERWRADDERTWWRGDMVERSNGTLRHGRYAIFAATEPSFTLTSPSGTYGPVTPRTWLYRQITGVIDALGYYGACEYLPANATYAVYEPWTAGVDGPGGMPLWMTWPNDGPYQFTTANGIEFKARGRWRLGFRSSFAMVDPATNGDVAWLVPEHRRVFRIGGEGSDAATYDGFVAECGPSRELAPLRPAHWPAARIATERFLRNQRYVCLSQVTWTSPIDGSSRTLSFTAAGTTLRGARRQRRIDRGWAAWDDAPAPGGDPHLDSAAP